MASDCGSSVRLFFDTAIQPAKPDRAKDLLFPPKMIKQRLPRHPDVLRDVVHAGFIETVASKSCFGDIQNALAELYSFLFPEQYIFTL